MKWTVDDTVEYKEVRTFHFVPEMSSGTEDDIVTIPNIPLAVSSFICNYASDAGVRMSVVQLFSTPSVTIIHFY